MRKTLFIAGALALSAGAFAQVSFDDITGANYTYYFNPQGSTYTAVAENTNLSSLDPINAVELIVYNPTTSEIDGAHVTISIMDASATNPNAGGPGNVLATATYGLSALAGQTYYDYVLPLSLTPTSTNVWTAFGFDNTSVATLINGNAPSVGSAPSVLFAVNTTASGWQDNYELGSGTIPPYFGLKIDTTPAPEPASMAVLGIGVVAMIRRRRSKKA